MTASTSNTPSSGTTLLDRSLFPDGLKTSGQHPILLDKVYPYDAFPKKIEGPTVWKPEEFQGVPDGWTRVFSDEEIEELGRAADGYIAKGAPLTGITREQFPLPTLGPYFDMLRPELLDGRGFVLLKGIPVDRWDNLKCAVAYLGLGTYFGYFTSQNGKGHILGHVQNLAEDEAKSNVPIRIYRTNKRQFFHTDGTDLVGLLCMAKAKSGGESDIASTHHVFNILQEEHPDVVKTLVEPNWWFDRKGEVSAGEDPWYLRTVLAMEDEPDAKRRRVFGKFDPMNVTTLQRYNTGPDAVLPPLSPEQMHAIEVLEQVAGRCALHMVLDPGDIQLLANSHILHARTEYEDWPAGAVDEQGRPRKQRQLMRLWLATPEDEGGWKLPYVDSKDKKRGGVQVDDTPAHCPLGAE